MKEFVLEKVDLFLTENFKLINNMNIYDLKGIIQFKEIKTLFEILKLDNTVLTNLIKSKEDEMLKELQDLLDKHALPVIVEPEGGSRIVFYYKEEKIGRLSLCGGDLDIFATTIKKDCNKLDVTFFYNDRDSSIFQTEFRKNHRNSNIPISRKVLSIEKPNYFKSEVIDVNYIYTSFKYLNRELNSLKEKLDNLIESKNRLELVKNKINKRDFKDETFLNKLSLIIYKNKWIEYVNIMIDSVELDINEITDFIKHIENIETTDNECFTELTIKHNLKNILKSELGL